MLKSLIIGAESYLASNYIDEYLNRFSKIVAFSHRKSNPRLKYDLFKPNFNVLDNVIDDSYKYAIIFAGISNNSFCEKEKEYTYKCNVEGILNTVNYFYSNNIVPIVFSSDYVFDGKKGNYSEKSNLNPLNEYGKQKAKLEGYMLDKFADHCMVIRLSKVFDSKIHKKNFLGEIISNLVCGNTIKLAYDQIFSPIHIEDLINIIFQLQEIDYRGLINVCGKESLNRYNLGKKIMKEYKIGKNFVEKISIDDLNENFKRPKNISMGNKKLISYLNLELHSIDWHIKQTLKYFI